MSEQATTKLFGLSLSGIFLAILILNAISPLGERAGLLHEPLSVGSARIPPSFPSN